MDEELRTNPAMGLGVDLDAPVTALRLDSEGRITDASESAAAMLGLTPDEIHGLTLSDLVADQWQTMAEGARARILCGDNRAFQLLLRSRRGREAILVQMASRPVRDGAKTSYVLSWSGHFSQQASLTADFDMSGQRRLANGLLRAIEADRTRVAAELDNGITPLVAVAKFTAEDAVRRIEEGRQPDGVELINAARGRLEQALVELQRVATELRPRMLDDLGLLPTLQWLCRGFEQCYRTIQIEQQLTVGEGDLPVHLNLVIFRLVEEALANVAQHANASRVQVALMRAAEELLIWVQDDGDGFDAGRYGAGLLSGIGLASMRMRVEATGGRLTVQSKPNRGARIGAKWSMASRTDRQ
jgi:two-component system, NarL family, sensor kinase